MKVALITGASRGIGLCISKNLIANGYMVYGIARGFLECQFSHENFKKLSFDLLQVDKLESFIKENIDKELDLLINNAGVGFFSMHCDIKIDNIIDLTTLNLTVPLILTKLFTKDIKANKGSVVFISSASALKPSPFGSAYSATKAALIQFNKSYFEEIRKSGAKSIVAILDITDTNFFDNLSFYPSKNEDSFLKSSDVAHNIINILNQKSNIVINEIVIKPQLNLLNKRKQKAK